MRNQILAPRTVLFISKDILALRRRRGDTTTSWVHVALLAAWFLLTGCAGEKLFQSNFGPTPVGQPPATVQDVGTAHIEGPPGSVIVIALPELPGKWVQISRPHGGEVAGFQGKFSQLRGDSVYTFSATMFMASGSGVASIQFETLTNQVFLHLDFMENNQIRIDDNAGTKFGSFPRDQPFLVQVTLNINASASTAHIQPIAFGAATATVDFNGGGIHHVVGDPVRLQKPV